VVLACPQVEFRDLCESRNSFPESENRQVKNYIRSRESRGVLTSFTVLQAYRLAIHNQNQGDEYRRAVIKENSSFLAQPDPQHIASISSDITSAGQVRTPPATSPEASNHKSAQVSKSSNTSQVQTDGVSEALPARVEPGQSL